MTLAVALLVGLGAAGGCTPAPRYPSSPRWRGDRFANPPAWPPSTSLGDFFRWQRLRRAASAVGYYPPQVDNDGARLRRNRERVSLTWIGHATLLLQGGGLSLLTDPNFFDVGGVIPRRAAPGVALKDLPPIDVVVISHNHRDHLDADSVDALGPAVHYIVPLGLGPWFRDRGLSRVTELDWWQSLEVVGRSGGRGTITMVPAQHWSQRGLGDRNRSLWGGYVIDAGDRRIYFAGDTGYPAAFVEIGRRFPGIDYALLPIGAYEPRWFMAPQHISPEQAAVAFHELRARALVPMHWGTFHLGDEPMDEPPRLLAAAMGPDGGRILWLPIGGSYFPPRRCAPAAEANALLR